MDKGLTLPLFARACRIFLEHAYPEGPDSIPAKKRLYFDLPLDQALAQFLPPAPPAMGVCEEIRAAGGGVRGYALRLGSAHFPHLKLKLQLVDYDNATVWVFTVDTHDAFSRESFYPPPDHPDAPAWREMQKTNRLVKERVENALEKNGIATFPGLLRRDLEKPLSPR